MKIEKIKKVGNKYKIILENNEIINTYDEIIINNNILYKKELDDQLIKKINQETTNYDIYNKVLKYINTKLRSEFEIKKYLEKLNVNNEYQEIITSKLKTSNLINDALYTKAYIHDRLCFSNDGPHKIKKDLEQHKIDKQIIANEINAIDKQECREKLKKQITSKIVKNTKYSSNMLKQKLLNHYLNLGYDKNDILFIIENIKTDNSSIIKKEYDKLYNKYKNKYSGEQLKYFIKNKLYQKGFNIEEISEIINSL